MNLKQRQSGITIWGMLMIAALIVFFVLMGMKLIPGYVDFYKVRTALTKVGNDPGVGRKSRQEIIDAIDKYFEIDDVRSVDLKQDVKIEVRGRMRVITIEYEYVTPMVGNLYALMQFKHSVEVPLGG